MAPGPTRDDRTINRWKRTFLGTYLAFTLGAVFLAFFSILAVQCGARPVSPRGPRIGESANSPAELRQCHHDLERLLADLHREAFTVQAKALRFNTDPASEWRNWSAAWELRWRSLDWRCRFGDLAGTQKIPEIERMAAVHATLEELHLSYSGLVDRFVDTYAARLHKMRTELSEIRTLIDRRSPAPPPTHAEPTGATR